MTAREAANVADEAGVATLVLTHIWPTTDRGAILEEAGTVFGGEILVAEESMRIVVG
jgi:ribonuclease BN (tRNA processing enzyme)